MNNPAQIKIKHSPGDSFKCITFLLIWARRLASGLELCCRRTRRHVWGLPITISLCFVLQMPEPVIPLFPYALVNDPQSSKALWELDMRACLCLRVSLRARLRVGRGLAEGRKPGQLIDRTNQYTHCLESHKGAGRQRHRLLLLSACARMREGGETTTCTLHQICHQWINTLTRGGSEM